MAGQDLKSAKRFFLSKQCFYYRLLNPFPETGFLSGIDSGFFALNIVMNFRNLKFREPKGTLNMAAHVPGVVTPIQRQLFPQGGMVLGVGSSEDFWTPDQLNEVARSGGYLKSGVIQGVDFETIKKLVNSDQAVLVAFDVDSQGNPGCYGGANAHWAVIVGYGIFNDGRRYIIATHSWGGFYVWTFEQLCQSNTQLLMLPQSSQQTAVANGPAIPAASQKQAVSLNEVRNKLVVIAT